jgi:hypothetical protein
LADEISEMPEYIFIDSVNFKVVRPKGTRKDFAGKDHFSKELRIIKKMKENLDNQMRVFASI